MGYLRRLCFTKKVLILKSKFCFVISFLIVVGLVFRHTPTQGTRAQLCVCAVVQSYHQLTTDSLISY